MFLSLNNLFNLFTNKLFAYTNDRKCALTCLQHVTESYRHCIRVNRRFKRRENEQHSLFCVVASDALDVAHVHSRQFAGSGVNVILLATHKIEQQRAQLCTLCDLH